MTVGELAARLAEFDNDLEVRIFQPGPEIDVAIEAVAADLPAHEEYVLIHDLDAIERHTLWQEANPSL